MTITEKLKFWKKFWKAWFY